MRNCLARKGGLLSETALARDRTIGGHASCARIALGQRQFLGHFGGGGEDVVGVRMRVGDGFAMSAPVMPLVALANSAASMSSASGGTNFSGRR